MEYNRTLSEIDLQQDVMNEINHLAQIKKYSDESFTIPRNEVLLRYFADEIKRQDEHLPNVRFDKNKNYRQADVVFRDTTEMAWQNG